MAAAPAVTANGLRWDERSAVPWVLRPRRKWSSSEEAQAMPSESVRQQWKVTELSTIRLLKI